MYALKIKSMATMDITTAHFMYKPSLTLKGELEHSFPSFSVETLIPASLLFQTFWIVEVGEKKKDRLEFCLKKKTCQFFPSKNL